MNPPPPSLALPTEPSEAAVAFRAAELFLRGNLRIPQIADVLNQEFPALPVRITRETVYPLLQKARALEFLRLVPPLEKKLAREIESRFGCPPGSVWVVDCPARESNEKVAVAAAEMAVELVKDLRHGLGGGPIGLGLGPGRATRDFSVAFSGRLQDVSSLPKLKLVALSAGCPANHPEYSSISFFNLFPPTSVEQQIGLFAGTLVRCEDYAAITARPGCREAFAAAQDIHLVVTSMGDMQDEHALLRIWCRECEKEWTPSWKKVAVGDIQYRPYSAKGFIQDDPGDLRAVTLFELADLVALAQKKNRHVILIARQCGLCEPRRTKARAVLPILKNPHMRVFSRLVLDSPTAYELLQAA